MPLVTTYEAEMKKSTVCLHRTERGINQHQQTQQMHDGWQDPYYYSTFLQTPTSAKSFTIITQIVLLRRDVEWAGDDSISMVRLGSVWGNRGPGKTRKKKKKKKKLGWSDLLWERLFLKSYYLGLQDITTVNWSIQKSVMGIILHYQFFFFFKKNQKFISI